MARLFGDQRQQQQFQIARSEDPRAASAPFTAGTRAFFEAVAAFKVFTVDMMVAHFSFSRRI
ncbi:hypothetical protein D3C76_1826440 [compost metagenome]